MDPSRTPTESPIDSAEGTLRPDHEFCKSIGPHVINGCAFPDSGNRLPLPECEELSDVGKRLLNETLSDERMLAGLSGPAGIQLRAPEMGALARPLFRYLREEAGLDRRLSELAILASARETDQHFEWYAHENVALRAGLEPQIIDVVRRREPLDGLGEKERLIITLARESIGAHAVSSRTFADAFRTFGAEDLILYVTLIGEYASTGYLLHVFGQELPAQQTSTLPKRD